MSLIMDAPPQSLVIATVCGVPMTEFPSDLFIPPDALKVLLDAFTGPLDLLLYLIRRQNIDIMDIPILKITRQYMDYIALITSRSLELAADYLVMAAMLAEIKSKLLLPVLASCEGEEEEDPRMALVRRLQVYEEYKQASMRLDDLLRRDRDLFLVQLNRDNLEIPVLCPDVSLNALVQSMQLLLVEKGHCEVHQISPEVLSVRSRMVYVLERLSADKVVSFRSLYTDEEGRGGLVVSLLAVLELARQYLLTLTQLTVFAPIYLSTLSIEDNDEFS